MYMNLNKGKTNDTYTYFYEVVGVNCDFVILVNKLNFNCIILNRYILLNIFLNLERFQRVVLLRLKEALSLIVSKTSRKTAPRHFQRLETQKIDGIIVRYISRS